MSEPLRILIVEDEALILMQIEMLLEDLGHVVVATAVTAEAGIALGRKTRPDLAFIDLRLRGGSSGLDVARALREQGGVAVVFVTANASQLGEDFAGAIAVIAKPFSEAILEGSMPYLERCVRHPPPGQKPPPGLRLAPRPAAIAPLAV